MSRLQAHLTPAGSREATPYDRFRAQINAVRKDIAAMIGEEKVDKFIRVCLNAAQHNPDVLAADRRTLLLACLEAAQDGLLPDGNEAVFNIYNEKVTEKNKPDRWVKTVQYLPMAYGIIQTIYEAGATYVDAAAVYEKDDFEYERGDEPRITHKPFAGNEAPGPVVAAYCVVKFPKLETKREVMFRRDIEKVKEKSKAPNGLMWKDFYDQGAIKSVVHRIRKQLPQHERLNRILAHDNNAVGLSDVASTVDTASLESIIDGKVEFVALEDKRVETGARDAVLGSGTLKPAAEALHAGATTTGGGEPPKAEGTTKAATDTTPAPKQGDKGTPELKAKFIAQIDRATTADVLGIAMDDVRFFVWEPADLAEITEKYNAKRGELGG